MVKVLINKVNYRATIYICFSKDKASAVESYQQSLKDQHVTTLSIGNHVMLKFDNWYTTYMGTTPALKAFSNRKQLDDLLKISPEDLLSVLGLRSEFKGNPLILFEDDREGVEFFADKTEEFICTQLNESMHANEIACAVDTQVPLPQAAPQAPTPSAIKSFVVPQPQAICEASYSETTEKVTTPSLPTTASTFAKNSNKSKADEIKAHILRVQELLKELNIDGAVKSGVAEQFGCDSEWFLDELNNMTFVGDAPNSNIFG